MNPHQLRFVDASSGALIRPIGNHDADQTVVLALSRDQADYLRDLVQPEIGFLETMTGSLAGAHLYYARNIREQIDHETEQLGPRENL